ncbi:hypothetical protein Mapa_016448 [Marchantia paleacea]|nr:hypothetical protein Mapa_016448 [Marchantia paleacea]
MPPHPVPSTTSFFFPSPGSVDVNACTGIRSPSTATNTKPPRQPLEKEVKAVGTIISI